MLSLSGIGKTYSSRSGDVVAVRDVTLAVSEGSFMTLLGPSGSGKTTILRCVAGLERPDGGTVEIAGTVVSDPARRIHVRPDRRRVGMVFQAPTVWPHMSVEQNVAFPLRHVPRPGRPSRAEAARRVQDVLRRVRLDGLSDRPATDLSGGQQQRLALARALVSEPRVLLLDEPLAALDAELREQIGAELWRIQQELGVTTMYVTHDRDEAFSLSTHVAVVQDGSIDQIGAPRDLYERPLTAFVARALGPANLIPCRVLGAERGNVVVDTVRGRLRVPANGTMPLAGVQTTIVSRPEHVHLEAGGDEQVSAAAFARDVVETVVGDGDSSIRARVPASEAFAPGTAVTVRFDEAKLVLLPWERDVR